MKKNDVCIVVGTVLNGIKVKIIRQSKKTGDFTVELIEGWRSYKIGDQVQVHGYELKKVDA